MLRNIVPPMIWLLALAVALTSCQSGPTTASPSSAGATADSGARTESAPAKPAPTLVQFNYLAKTAPLWNTYVAVSKGLFAAEGIELQTAVMATDVATPAIISGALDIASLAFDAIVMTGGAGDLVVIGSEAETPIYTLVGGLGVNGPADLKDRPIAALGPTSSTTAMLKKMLVSLGLNPADYQLLRTGGSPERYAALHSGQVSAAMLTQPFDIRAMREGLRPLSRSSDVVSNSSYTLHVTTRRWLQQNRPLAVGWLRAMIRATQWLYDPANRAEAEAILIQETAVDAETAAALYDLYLREVKIYRPDVEPRLTNLQGNIDLLIEVGALEPPGPNPEQYVELGPLKEAQASLAAR